jgi:hypothetical protein
VLRYLARYTHRIAITNRRLLALEQGQVTFRWKDYQRGNRQWTMTLDAVEFLRRFLLHVLPHGFQRTRHYGLFANSVRKVKLPLCRRAPASTAAREAAIPWPPRPSRSAVCPACHVGQMQLQDTWFSQRTAPDGSRRRLIFDTS